MKKAASQRLLNRTPPFRTSNSRSLILFGLLLVSIGIYASTQFLTMSSFTNVDRRVIFDVEEGTARYIYLTYWIPLGISFVFLGYLYLERRSRHLRQSVVLILAAALIIASIFWSGGRTILVTFSLPIFLIAILRNNRILIYAAPTYLSLIVSYVIYLSLIRADTLYFFEMALPAYTDWQLGRYSMIGYAIDFVDRNGLIAGESYLAAVTSVITLPVSALGLDLTSSFSSFVSIVGQDYFGNPDIVHIVPGSLAESYMNFGAAGVAAFYYILGRMIALIDARLNQAVFCSATLSIFYAYSGAIIVTILVNGTLQAALTYLFYIGFPLFVSLAIKAMYDATTSRKPASL